jgi:hypothetical protein
MELSSAHGKELSCTCNTHTACIMHCDAVSVRVDLVTSIATTIISQANTPQMSAANAPL